MRCYTQIRILFLGILFLFQVSVFAQFNVVADSPNARYQAGEAMNFEVTSNQSGTVDYVIRYDNATTSLASGSINVTAGQTANIPFTLNEAAGVLCTISQNGNFSNAGALFSPFEIDAFEAEPSDFDAFWASELAELATIPIDPQLQVFSSTAYSTTYKISLAQVDGRRIYGLISVPNAAGSYPAMLKLPSYGNFGGIVYPLDIITDNTGYISLYISIHNVDIDQADPNGYLPIDNSNEDEIYYRYGVLAAIRAIDYLTDRSDFNGNLVLEGISQGGGLATMAAGLDDRVDLVVSSIAALCQHNGLTYDRESGFPYFLRNARNSGGTLDEAATAEAVRYYDAIHFAKRYDGPSITFIGLEDEVCPPATSMAAYNQMGDNRLLILSRELGHQSPIDNAVLWQTFARQYFPETMMTLSGNTNSALGHAITAGNDQQVAAGATVNLTGSAKFNGAENNSWNYTWSKVKGPGNVNFTNPNNKITSVSFTTEGTYTLQLMAVDGSEANSQEREWILTDQIKIQVGTGGTDEIRPTITLSTDDDDVEGSFEVVATFSESVIDLNLNDFQINNLTLSNLQGSGANYTLTATPINEGNTSISLSANKVTDPAGNPNFPSNTLVVEYAPPCNDPDSDGDGVCDSDDNCPNDPNPDQADEDNDGIGDVCDDTDPVNNNCDATATGGAVLTITGLNNPREYVKVFKVPGGLVTTCDGTCESPLIYSNLELGTYTVEIQTFDQNWQPICNLVIEDIIITDGNNNDTDGDGVPNDQDQCEGFDDNLDADGDGIPDGCDDCEPSQVGQACDDGNDCTINDTFDSDCNCIGTDLPDTDGDGVCDAEDNCPDDFNPNQADSDNDGIGNVCDDPDPINNDCDATITGGTVITIADMNNPREYVKVYDAGTTNLRYSCNGNCDDDLSIILPPGDYLVDIETFRENWQAICNIEQEVTISDEPIVDTDGDGVPDDEDQCEGFDDSLDEDSDGIPDGCDDCNGNLNGTSCDDGDANTVNDAYDENCVCSGVVPVDSDGDGVFDDEDQCPGFDDNLDSDGDGIPDDCDDCDGTLVGTTCDDGNPDTENDVYDANCNCSGDSNNTCTSTSNLALNKSATQSSTIFGAVAARAVDGDTDGAFLNGSVTATDQEDNPWWQVDLGEVSQIESIDIWNRTDNRSDRLSDFYVLVSDVPFSSTDLTSTINQSGVDNYYSATEAGSPSPFTIGRTGRYVRIQLNYNEYLTLTEVEVMGCILDCTLTRNACDDGDICTENDVYDDNCNCVGTLLQDTDNDGVCDLEDNCINEPNPSQSDSNGNGIGDACDDTDPGTNDCVAEAIGGANITITGLSNPREYVKVYNSGGGLVFTCGDDCDANTVIDNLPDGDYAVDIETYETSWAPICNLVLDVTVTSGAAARQATLEQYYSQALQIFPNPTAQQTTIKLSKYMDKKVTLKVYHLTGKEMGTWEFDAFPNEGARLDLGHLPNGSYLITAEVDGHRMIGNKLVITRL